MEDNKINICSPQSEEDFNIQEILLRYLIHWPWFVASILLCVVCALGYLKIATPIYKVSATVLIKDDKSGSGMSMASELESMGIGNMVSNSGSIDNEIEVLKSKSLSREVVEQLSLYITYFDEDNWPNKKEMYRTSPVLVSLTPQEAEKLPGTMVVKMSLQPNGNMIVDIQVGDKKYNKQINKFPAVLPTDLGTVAFVLNTDSLLGVNPAKKFKERHITAYINRPLNIASSYAHGIIIKPTSKKNSVVNISLSNSNIIRGKDFLDKLIEVYNINTNNDKNEVAQNTAEFIDERIAIISEELGSTEQELEQFKRSAGITDLSSEAQIALSGNAEYEKKRVLNQTQINLVKDLQKYLQGNEYEVLPTNVGLQDAGLATSIARYNEMLMERNRLLRTSTENNPTIINLNSSIQAMRENVVASMEATLQGLIITKSDLAREAKRYTQRISDAPTQERQFVSMARQQEIKAGLYLMLLQKREENAITLAATANNAKIIDSAAAVGTVFPNRTRIILFSLILGIGVPIGVIYIIMLFKVKIEGRADVEKLTKLPIIGDIPIAEELQGSIAVFENKNNLMSETFRGIRTNLQFMMEEGRKVIMVTSTISGEGKSFVSANIAVSLAMLGKKVVIVGLDIRKPVLNKIFNLSMKEQGITQYLINPKQNIMGMVQKSGVNSNLFILPGGAVPPNPTELLAREGLSEAIEQLKLQFDYIILDTAPVGMVTDTQLIARVADLSIYVCRADYTRKSEFTLVNELANECKLPHLSIVINGLDLSKKKYKYYYGYGKYGKCYGYGKYYGYGEDKFK